MEPEKQDAILRLLARFEQILRQPSKTPRRIRNWVDYLSWLFHESTADPLAKHNVHLERVATVRNLDRTYGAHVSTDDLVHLARECGCDMFDVVLLMPTIAGDLNELRMGN